MKPILVIKVPYTGGQSLTDAIESKISKAPIKNDYHVIIVPNDKDDFAFEVFYEKDFNVIKYEELKKIVKDANTST